MAYKDLRTKRKRPNRIQFYLTDEELKLFNQLYEKSKYTNRETFIRQSVLNTVIVIKDYKYLDKVTNEINKIGVNINQIAKFANSNGELYKGQIEMLKKEMNDLWELLSEKL